MQPKVGDRVEVESESTERPPRTGIIEDVVRDAPSPRYRIRWDDGHETIYTPAAGALRVVEPAERS
jgi:phage baseplate assembly protein gpV